MGRAKLNVLVTVALIVSKDGEVMAEITWACVIYQLGTFSGP